MRQLLELVETPQPAWPAVREAIDSAPVVVQVLRGNRARCDETLLRLQVTTRNVLGALVHQTGGLLVDEGWLRHLGGGCAGLPDVATANGIDARWPADRRTGGAGHRARRARRPVRRQRHVAPRRRGRGALLRADTLRWEPLEVDHAEFVAWSMSGATSEFYAAFRWTGWEDEVRHLPLSMGVCLVPPPFLTTGRDVSGITRRVIPWDDLQALYADPRAGAADRTPA
jgi:hypothetical protein